VSGGFFWVKTCCPVSHVTQEILLKKCVFEGCLVKGVPDCCSCGDPDCRGSVRCLLRAELLTCNCRGGREQKV
jgi:hypothetical protein